MPSPASTAAENGSVELVFKYDDATSDGTLLEAQKGSGTMALRRPNEKKMYLITTAGGANGKAVPGTEFCVLSMERDQYMSDSLRYNDVAQTRTGWESPFKYVPDNTTTISIGQQPDGTYPFAGRLYAIRVYEGQLTTEEATQTAAFTWPDSGIAYIPIGQTVAVDDTNKAGQGGLALYEETTVTCEAPNVFRMMNICNYQSNTPFDLNGYDQNTSQLCGYSGGGHQTTGNPIVRFTSATPAPRRRGPDVPTWRRLPAGRVLRRRGFAVHLRRPRGHEARRPHRRGPPQGAPLVAQPRPPLHHQVMTRRRELLFASLAAQALAQIKEKGYAEKYLRRGKKVTLVGAAFDAEMRNLSDRRIEVA